MPSTLTWIIIVTLINGLLAFAGSIFFFISKKKLEKILILLVSFTTGALLGGALIHFIPEALEQLSLINTTLLTLTGFILFLFLEKFLYWHHCHDGQCNNHAFTYLLLYGDGIHYFIDGLIIAGSFLISIPFGIVTGLLVLVHELPQEISDLLVDVVHVEEIGATRLELLDRQSGVLQTVVAESEKVAGLDTVLRIRLGLLQLRG